jgi:hypothetical protein
MSYYSPTKTFTGGISSFIGPQWKNYPSRFYGIGVPWTVVGGEQGINFELTWMNNYQDE